MANEFKAKNGVVSPKIVLQGSVSGTTTILPSSAASGTYTLPPPPEQSGLALTSDTSGNLSWAAIQGTGGGGGGSTVAYTTFTYTADGTATTFAAIPNINVDTVLVIINGVTQTPNSDYTTSGSNVIFTTPPEASDFIQIRCFGGYPGVQGLKGIQGSQGFGYAQLQGVQGIQGTQGTQGIQGNQGLQGPGAGLATVEFSTYNYTGDGTTTAFAIANNQTTNNVLVFENGVSQTPISDYSVVGSNVVFTTAPATGVSIQIRIVGGLIGIQGTAGTNGTQGTAGSNGTQGTNGIQGLQGISGESFNQGLQGLQGIQGLQGSGAGLATVEFSTYTYTGNGTTTAFAIANNQTTNNVLVFENGVSQTPISDYSVVGSNVVFTTAPETGVSIQIRIVGGLIGIQGTAGYIGADGAQGRQGTQGLQGFGYAQLQGVQGTQGIQGIQGQGVGFASVNFDTYTFTGNGTTTSYTLIPNLTVHTVIVTLNGVTQTPTTDFTISGSNLVFSTAPANNTIIQIKVLGGIIGLQGTQGVQGVQGVQGTQGFGYAQLQGVQGVQGTIGTTPSLQTETLNVLTGSTGVVAHDYNTGGLWIHTGISANFTANFTNVPTTNNRTNNFTLMLYQGASPYYPNVVQIDGVAQTILWFDGNTPIPVANKTEIATFSLVRVSDTWRVLGSYGMYG